MSAVSKSLPSLEDDAGAHQRLILQLREAGGSCNGQLARMLEGCALGRRCKSGACILCGRTLQLAMFELIEKHLREPARRTMRWRMSAVTIIPAEGIVLPGELTVESCWRAMEGIVAALNQAGLTPAVGGFDVSFNEDEEGENLPHWSAHGHLTTNDWLSSKQKEVLRAAVSPSAWVRRPVKVLTLDDRDNGPLYTIKPDRARKVSYLDSSKVHLGRAPFRNTHRRDLRPDQAVALAQVEHELGLRNRVLFRGIPEDAVRTALCWLYWPQDGP